MELENGKLVIISGPSGSGKSTVVRGLLETCYLPLVVSVSATTREPRTGERDGFDYHFLSKETFAERLTNGDFLESKEVFGRGHWYGTLRDEVQTGLSDGKWVVLEIDVEGALAVLKEVPDCITIFVHTSSLDELERRLRNRKTDSEASIQRRLEVAQHELDQRHQYKHAILNQRVDDTVQEVCKTLAQYGENT